MNGREALAAQRLAALAFDARSVERATVFAATPLNRMHRKWLLG
jgi:hypothetical protein